MSTTKKNYLLPSLPELLEAGVHFGHQSRRWNPHAAKFIFTKKNGIHIIDLALTVEALDKACSFLYEITKSGGSVVFVGTKRQAREIVKREAERCGAFYVTERWLGGTLTNFVELEKNLQKLRKLKKDLEGGFYDSYTKKERREVQENISRLERFFGGIETLAKRPEAIFVVDMKRERTAVKEALAVGVPVVAIVDTNSDPDLVDYAIPGNDDAIRAVDILVSTIADAVASGYTQANVPSTKQVSQEAPLEKVTVLPLSDLGLSSRVTAVLGRAGVTTLTALKEMPEETLLGIKGLGPKSIAEIKKVLTKK